MVKRGLFRIVLFSVISLAFLVSFIYFLATSLSQPEQKINAELSEIARNNPKSQVKVLVQLAQTDKEVAENIISKGGKVKESSDKGLVVAELKASDLNYISENANVKKIWPDRETKVFLDFSAEQINAPYLWDSELNGDNVKIAILDTGVDDEHPMLQGRVILQKDFTGANDPKDHHGHGTHVAGIAAGNNASGGTYNGIAPKALILNGKVLNDGGFGYLSWLINGIDWALNPDGNPETDDGADIISLSLGATYSGDPEELLSAPEILEVKEAVEGGVVVVIASGNCGSGRCGNFEGVTTPGISSDAITVGAVNDYNEWATFSSGDTISGFIKPDVAAPGVSICSSFLNGNQCLSGTSQATPHVSGTTALLLQKNPSLSPTEIKSMLELSSLDLGETGKDVKFGSGLIDLSKILEANMNKTKTEGINYQLRIPTFTVGTEDTIEIIVYNYMKEIVSPSEETEPIKEEKPEIKQNQSEDTKSNTTDADMPQTDSVAAAAVVDAAADIAPKEQPAPPPKIIEQATKGKNLKISVEFSLEELDFIGMQEETAEIPSGKSRAFTYSWRPKVMGKHLLIITIKDVSTGQILEQIQTPVNAEGSILKLMEVRLLQR